MAPSGLAGKSRGRVTHAHAQDRQVAALCRREIQPTRMAGRRLSGDGPVLSSRYKINRPMTITMVSARVVQHTLDQIVEVIAMRDRLVAAARSVMMTSVAARLCGINATPGIAVGHGQAVFVVVGDLAVDAVWMVEMTVVEVVHVALMTDGGVSAPRAVLVGVVLMTVACAHDANLMESCRFEDTGSGSGHQVLDMIDHVPEHVAYVFVGDRVVGEPPGPLHP